MNIDLLRESFGEEIFTIREASALLGTSVAATRTILRDLRVRGLLTRTAPGHYQTSGPPRPLELERTRMRLRLELALATPLRVGLDGPDAIHLWTDGRYRVADDPGILHVAVAEPDAEAYQRHLDEAGLRRSEPFATPARRPFVVVRKVRPDELTFAHGQPVLARHAILALIRAHPIAYEGAEQWLR